MKLAAQSDFYVKHYGSEAGLKRLKEIGYQAISYSISDRYDAPFTTEWTDLEIKEHFAPIGEAIKNSGLELTFVTVSCDVYNDHLPQTTQARRQMCVQAAKAAYYMGAKAFAIPLIAHNLRVEDPIASSGELSCQLIEAVKTVTDQFGLQLCIFNNKARSNQYSFGCRASELLELCKSYDAHVIVDPVNAHKAGERIGELLSDLGDNLYAFVVTDVEKTMGNPFMPMMGCVNYPEVIKELSKLSNDILVVMSCTPVFNRYKHFNDVEAVNDAVSQLLFDMGNTIINNETV